jgi:hypothetical protein
MAPCRRAGTNFDRLPGQLTTRRAPHVSIDDRLALEDAVHRPRDDPTGVVAEDHERLTLFDMFGN